jgi:hypothetical protein
MKFALSLGYNALLNDFFDQTYFVIFASTAKYLGDLNLIRGFGSLFIRFMYMPINNVTYNLYAQLWTDSLKAKEQDKLTESRASVSKILAVVKMVVFLYSRLTYFMLAYGVFTAKVFLSLLFGSVWVTEVTRLYKDFYQRFPSVHRCGAWYGSVDQPRGFRQERL